MPAQRPRAAFEPIAPTFDVNQLVEQTPNFQYVDRISCDQIAEHGIEQFEALVLQVVIKNGKPLVIDGFDSALDPWTFTPKWLRDNVGSKVEQSRNLSNKEYLPLTMTHYLNHMGQLANQFFENPRNYKDKSRQRIYLKDIDCPQVWHDKLSQHIPPSLFYLNESTGEPGGPGAEIDHKSNLPGRRMGRGTARAGDLMSSLPHDMRAENLQCYIGHEGTYTPAHREMCATMGHNIMVEASGDIGEDGKPEKPGSSLWFMTESKDRNTVAEYWLSVLGHDIEVESHFAQISAWKKAPFTVYVVEQKPGDFILIPPLAPHQVWNRGTRTMKVAWNRTTVETLEMALDEALPKAKIVCRDEQYKNKAIIYYTLLKYSALLTAVRGQAEKLPLDSSRDLMASTKIKQLIRDFKKLFALYKRVLLSETFSLDGPQERCEYLPFDSNVTCAYCRGNIFNRFLSCQSCKDALGHEEDEPYDVCMDCYVMGRSCGCISNLKWVEQFKWKELSNNYETWRKLLIELDGGRITAKTPLPLAEEKSNLHIKTLAEVCREQLKKRPFTDIKKPKERPVEEESEEDIIVDDEGRVKKTVKKRSKAWLKTHTRCHICQKRHEGWKCAKCTTCEKQYCYGSLFRGADMMPIEVMQDPNWSCPHCRNVCYAGGCRKDPRQTPIEPKGTLLGHDTKKVADARSVECLVDFSMSNLNWLKDGDDDEESARIKRAREEAQRAKENESHLDDDDDQDQDQNEETQVNFEYSPDGTPAAARQNGGGSTFDSTLDPALQGESKMLQTLSRANQQLRAAPTERRRQSAFTIGSGGNADVPEGYAPATTAGFAAPSASVYPEPDDSGYAYPDPEDAHRSVPEVQSQFRSFGKPRKRARHTDGEDQINMDSHPKKRRVTEDASLLLNRPRNEATAQYEKEKEKKALEEARKQGRFVVVQAAMKGKKRIVKLSVPGARLAQLLAGQAAAHVQQHPASHSAASAQEAPEETILLRSDIAPAKEKTRKSGGGTKMLVRVEKDEDYGMKSDRHHRADVKRRRHTATDYEEVDVSMDDDDSDDQENGGNDFGATTGKSRDGPRRMPSYIQRKHLDDPDLPDELPENFKDSKPGARDRRSGSNGGRPSWGGARQNSSTSGRASVLHRRSDGRFGRPRPSTGAESTAAQVISDDNSSSPEPTQPAEDIAQDSGNALPIGEVDLDGLSTAEANRLAKLKALEMLEGSGDDDDEGASPPAVRAPTVGTGRPMQRSIFDKNKGKKVRIVSASSKA